MADLRTPGAPTWPCPEPTHPLYSLDTSSGRLAALTTTGGGQLLYLLSQDLQKQPECSQDVPNAKAKHLRLGGAHLKGPRPVWAGGWSRPLGGLSPPWELTQLRRPILENESEFHEGLISLQNFWIHSFFKVLSGTDYMPGPAGTVMSKVGLVLVPTACHNETPYFSLLSTVQTLF